MANYHIAQINIGRIRAELDDPIMAGFVARLDEINALADGSPGFVWRLAVYAALWWVPAGHIPGIDEAKKRLAHLEAHGPTEFAFTLKSVFPPTDEFQGSIDWSSFVPCPATA